MKNLFTDEVYVGDLYQELLVGLNGLIEKTVEIQKATLYNSQDYREALRTQIELEKNKLNIMEMLREGLETKLTNKELVGYDDLGKEIFEVKETGDVRFIGKLTNEDVKKINNKGKEVTVIVDATSTEDSELNVIIDGKCAGKLKINLNKLYNENASKFATEIMETLKKNKGGLI